jgi:hypothetical protein
MNLLTGQIGATLIGYGTPQIGAYIGLSNVLLLSAFIYATAAPSGGHLNPTITFCTMLSGICPVPRGVSFTPAFHQRALPDDISGPVYLRANPRLGGGRRRLGRDLGKDEKRRVGLPFYEWHLSRR